MECNYGKFYFGLICDLNSARRFCNASCFFCNDSKSFSWGCTKLPWDILGTGKFGFGRLTVGTEAFTVIGNLVLLLLVGFWGITGDGFAIGGFVISAGNSSGTGKLSVSGSFAILSTIGEGIFVGDCCIVSICGIGVVGNVSIGLSLLLLIFSNASLIGILCNNPYATLHPKLYLNKN